jgi:hypothetical protein
MNLEATPKTSAASTWAPEVARTQTSLSYPDLKLSYQTHSSLSGLILDSKYPTRLLLMRLFLKIPVVRDNRVLQLIEKIDGKLERVFVATGV